MPAIAYYPPLPLYAGISAILCAGFLFLAFRKLRRDKKWGKATLSITLAAVFAVLALSITVLCVRVTLGVLAVASRLAH